MTDYEQLELIIHEAEELIKKRVKAGDPSFAVWQMKAKRFLIKRFTEISVEYDSFCNTQFTFNAYPIGMSDDAFIRKCQQGLQTTIEIFKTYLSEMKRNDIPRQKTKRNGNNIFIVHGHDGELKESVARLVEKQGIEPIILSDKANQGKTIIEKIEKYSDVGGAICLFTADDLGREKNESELKVRARQNVVFEAGYFMGQLGRDHIAIIAENGIEMPSDLSGVVYTNKSNWELDLLRELKAMGYSIDYNKLD